MVEKSKRKINPAFIIKRVSLVAACFLLFVVGISLGVFFNDLNISSESDINTRIYLDVNPSIELQLNDEDKVVSCIALNDDAEEIISELDLENVNMNTALTAIVGSMYVKGYLSTTSNSILVSVDSEENNNALLVDISNKINNIFEKSGMECSIIAQNVEIDRELENRAKENGISAGKMHLVDKMINEIDGFSENDRPSLSGMSIKELNLMYSKRPEPKDDGHDPFDNDVTSGEIGGYLNDEAVINAIVEASDLDYEEIERYFVRAKLAPGNEERKMLYEAKVILKSGNELLFEVDCATGEIIKLDSSVVPPPSFKDDEKDFPEEFTHPIKYK